MQKQFEPRIIGIVGTFAPVFAQALQRQSDVKIHVVEDNHIHFDASSYNNVKRADVPVKLLSANNYRQKVVNQKHSNNTVSRNKPCPCGSGKKAKRCCHS